MGMSLPQIAAREKNTPTKNLKRADKSTQKAGVDLRVKYLVRYGKVVESAKQLFRNIIS